MVSKQTGMIITAVMAVLFGCAAIFTCLTGLLNTGALFRTLQYGGPFVAGAYTGLGETVCTSLGFIALPVVFYVILVASHKETSAAAPDPEAKDEPKQ